MAMIYAVGHVSGAHLNPAVTLAFALNRHFPWTSLVGYWAAQLAGALAAAAILRGSLGKHRARRRDAAVRLAGASRSSGSCVLTFFLMFVIMAVATDTRAVGEAAAIAIGGTVGLDAMFGGPISGASMNPARSIGPAFVSGDLHALWLYIAAPLLGAALGAAIYRFLRGGRQPSHLTAASRSQLRHQIFTISQPPAPRAGRTLRPDRIGLRRPRKETRGES